MKTWRKGVTVSIIALIMAALIIMRHQRQRDLGIPFVPVSSNNSITSALHPRVSEMTDERKAAFTKMFNDRFKPAVERWCKAYSGRIPFKAEDVKLDCYNSMLGDNLYTFMIGSTTLTVADNDNSAHVVYMMTKEAAHALNSIPTSGRMPDLSVPVTRDQVLDMVKDDRGVIYPPSKVQITPSAEGTTLDGGALVTVNQTMMNGGILLDGKSFSLVFDKNGKLVHYEGPML